MLEYTITFFAVFFTDIIYVNLVKSIQQDHIFHAAFLGTTITFANSVAIINYTNDHLAIFPALAGAFIGTLIGMKVRKRAQM